MRADISSQVYCVKSRSGGSKTGPINDVVVSKDEGLGKVSKVELAP